MLASCFHCRRSEGSRGGQRATDGEKVDFLEELLLVVSEFADHGGSAHVAEGVGVWD